VTTILLQLSKLFAILQKYDFSSKSQQKFTRPNLFTVVCDTAKVRFFKQITTDIRLTRENCKLFAILQKYDFSSKSQLPKIENDEQPVVCDTAKVRFFKQITTVDYNGTELTELFAILQKYDFSSKSQRNFKIIMVLSVVCDTAKVRFFKQITTLII